MTLRTSSLGKVEGRDSAEKLGSGPTVAASVRLEDEIHR